MAFTYMQCKLEGAFVKAFSSQHADRSVNNCIHRFGADPGYLQASYADRIYLYPLETASEGVFMHADISRNIVWEQKLGICQLAMLRELATKQSNITVRRSWRYACIVTSETGAVAPPQCEQWPRHRRAPRQYRPAPHCAGCPLQTAHG